MRIRIGTRKSKLALIQATLVINEILRHYPDSHCEIVPIITSGDLITDRNLYEIGGKALFLKELEQALQENKIDIAVHSLKDVPGRISNEFIIGGVLAREDVRDVLVSPYFSSVSQLPLNAKVGSSSPRRKVLLKKQRSDLDVIPFRGNIDSRLKKLMQSEVAAIILAAAGLKRLGLFDEAYCHIISPEEMLPAAGQGIIALETKANNLKMLEICSKINHQLTWQLIQAERAFLEYLDADCKTPLAAYATMSSSSLIKVDFMLSDFEGSKILFHTESGLLQQAGELGIKAAMQMRANILSLQ